MAEELKEQWLEILTNQPEKSKDVLELLLRVTDNIVNSPDKVNYRQLKPGNSKVRELITIPGALESLHAMGFKQTGDMLIMDAGDSTNCVERVRDQIKTHLNPNPINSESSSASTNSSSTADQHWHILEFPTYPPEIDLTEVMFLRKLQTSFEHVRLYESPELQKKALEVIPSKTLREKAQANFTNAQSHGNQSSLGLDEYYILALMDWYKEEFFRWVSKPACDRCGGETTGAGWCIPTEDDLRYEALNVELYNCGSGDCGTRTRFPRYNDPGKLLETRRGRSGEWTNCFTLLCRASGYEARYVLDWTDHVWTEVFSKTQNRWLHCDPCEKELDNPLLYENVWEKKLTYIIAFSKDEINDVTWRYSANSRALVSRRVDCRETWLCKTLENLRQQRQGQMNGDERLKHQQRLIKECAEFISSKCSEPDVGNTSGETALHMNNVVSYDSLLERITLNSLKELLSFRDNKTVCDTTGYWKEALPWFTRQYERKNYPLYDYPRVLILYNTDDRLGAEEEAKSIQQAFKSVISSIELEEMGRKPEVLQLIEQQAANRYTSLLIVCLMSHGNIGTIDDSKRNQITLTSIEGAMCSDVLKERPKILIIQSCQTRAEGKTPTNKEEATSSNTDRPPASASVPNRPYEPVVGDFLSVQSCLSGQVAIRNIFVPYLAEEIKNSSEEDNFEDLVKNVSHKIEQENFDQIPIVKSTLRGKVCLKDQCPYILVRRKR